MALRIIYTLLVGIFLSIFVGVGISAFYKGPVYPEMPPIIKYCTTELKDAKQNAELKAQAEKFDIQEKNYRTKEQIYSKNVAIIAIIAATVLVILSLTLSKKVFVIADGVLLGGVLTLIYSVMRGFQAEDTMFQFFVVSIGLLISLVLGYIKFIKSITSSNKK